MRPWLAIVCGISLLAVALIVEAPASLLELYLAAIAGGRIHVANTSGTLWRGAGELVLADGDRRRIAWRLDPWALLGGEVRGSLSGEGTAPDARFAVDGSKLELDGFALTMPIAELQRAAGVSSTLASAGGEIAIRVDRLVRDTGAIDVQLALQWRDASIAGPGAYPRIALGEIQAELSGRGREVSGPVTNRGGEVEIDGRVTASAAGRQRIEASIRPRPGIDKGHAEAIVAVLSAIGTPDAQGGYRIAWAGGGR